MKPISKKEHAPLVMLQGGRVGKLAKNYSVQPLARY